MTINGQEIEEAGEYWFVHIRKPIYGTVVAINEKILAKAEKLGKHLVISTKGIEKQFTPQGWRKQSKRFEKVFNYPDNPMVIWQGDVRA